jgi:hypothetical protein
VPVLKSGPKLAKYTFGISKPAEMWCLSVCELIVSKTDAIRPPGDPRSDESAGVPPDTGANVTAEAAIPAISEHKPMLSRRPLTRLKSRERPKWTCSTLMLILSTCRDLLIALGNTLLSEKVFPCPPQHEQEKQQP